jgi:hypothetical protein
MNRVATINGNIIMIPFSDMVNLTTAVSMHGLTQYSVFPIEAGAFMLSTPITQSLEDSMPGILHGARARAKDVEKPKPPTGPKGNPPNGGGTPGTPTIDTYTKTEAMAA